MTVRDTPWAPGTPCWVDLSTSDLEAAKTFYSELFGWQLQVGGDDVGGYTTAEIDGKSVAGLMAQTPEQEQAGAPVMWASHFATEDIDAAIAKVTEAGGTVVAGPMDVVDIGRLCIVADPSGGVFGLWQARTFEGAQLVNEPGAFTWNELYTRDFDKAKEFYAAVFGYTFTDVAPGMDYVTMDVDGKPVGGIGAMPSGVPAQVPAHWRVYFAVGDADQALEHVTKLGGTVLDPAKDSPFGRWGDAADAQGGQFSVIKLPPAQ